ncbi:glycosyltransferase family 39 protein [Nocardioides ungokensis]|uniref:glycosyltransferase family 39 protein n=1 Tax=Nocardioides ungokensis TaxID=1643322 RepID=UPI0015DDAD48|nr:glycosyltransferase family 39 protein [Nocardioides ungokensis]
MTVLRGAERVGGEARVLVPDTVLPRSRWIRRRAAPRPSLRGRFARLDPLVALTCVVAAAVFVLHGFDGVLSRDLGVYMYAGQQVADGVAPYAGILNRAGPLAHLLPGIGVAAGRWVGADDVLSARVLFMVLSVACVGTAYVLGRDLFRSRPAGLATAAALLCFEGFIRYATYGPREKTAMVLFLLCALLAVTHRRWLTAGCFVALATLTWQPALFAALAAAVTAALLAPTGTRLRALARIAIGGLVPTAVTVAVFVALGELRTFLDDFLLINLQYTHQAPLLNRFGKTWGVLGTPTAGRCGSSSSAPSHCWCSPSSACCVAAAATTSGRPRWPGRASPSPPDWPGRGRRSTAGRTPSCCSPPRPSASAASRPWWAACRRPGSP